LYAERNARAEAEARAAEELLKSDERAREQEALESARFKATVTRFLERVGDASIPSQKIDAEVRHPDENMKRRTRAHGWTIRSFQSFPWQGGMTDPPDRNVNGLWVLDDGTVLQFWPSRTSTTVGAAKLIGGADEIIEAMAEFLARHDA
jgi:hypothetical protein